MHSATEEVSLKIHRCKEEKDIDKQISILKDLNKLLPANRRIALQTSFTNDYIRRVLCWIEEEN
jgi:hypothetical protein